MSSFLSFLSGGDNHHSKKNGKSKGSKPRSLRLEQLESREMLNGTGLDTEPFAIASLPTSGETILVAAQATTTKPTITGTMRGDYSVDLSWTNLGANYTYSLVRNGSLILDGVSMTSYYDPDTNLANKTYYLYAKDTTTGQTVASDPYRIGESFRPTLTATSSGGVTTLKWTDQGPNFSYMLTRNGVSITGYLTVNSFEDKGAPSGQANEYVLYVYNQASQKWVSSDPVAAGTLSEPTNFRAENIGLNEATLKWTPPTKTIGAAGYRIERYDTVDKEWVQVGNIVPIGTNECTLTALAQHTDYQFRISTVSTQGTVVSSPFQTVSFTTLSPVKGPTGLTVSSTVSPTDTTVTLNWTEPTDTSMLSKYRIDWSLNGTDWFVATTAFPTTLGTKSATVTGLDPNTAYYFRISGLGTSGEVLTNFDKTTATIHTKLEAPTLLRVNTFKKSATNGKVDVELSWTLPNSLPSSTDPTKVVGYQITWSGGSVTVGPNVATTTIKGLNPSATYSFTIVSVNGDDSLTSAPLTLSNVQTPAGFLAAPGTFTADKNNLTWTASTDIGATGFSGYRIEYIGPNGTWNNPEVINNIAAGATSVQTPVTAPGTYTFRIYSVGTSASGLVSDGYKETTLTIYPAAATVTKVIADSPTQATVTWTKAASGVDHYVVQYSTNGTSWGGDQIVDISKDSAIVTGLVSNQKYFFRVLSVDAWNKTSTSNENISVRMPLYPPQSATAAAVAGKWDTIRLQWTAPLTGAAALTGYKVEYSANGGSSWTAWLSNHNGLTTDIDGLTANTYYMFRVTSVNSGTGTESVTPAEAATTTNMVTLTAPQVKAQVEAETNALTLHWEAVSGANGYEITYTPVAGGTPITKTVPGGASTYYRLPGLAQATDYVISIVAVGTTGVTPSAASPFDTHLTKTTVDAVTGNVVASSVTANSALLTWDWRGVPTNLYGFKIQKSENGGAWTNVYTLTDLTKNAYDEYAVNVNELKADTDYQFRVVAIGANKVESKEVDSNKIHTLVSGKLTLTGIGSTIDSITVQWTTPAAGTAFTGYVLEWKDHKSTLWSNTPIDIPKTNTDWTIDTGLLNGTYYDFRIKAVNGSIVSEDSETLTLHTQSIQIAAPDPVVAVGYTNSIYVTWDLPANNLAQGFIVYWQATTGGKPDQDEIKDGGATFHTIENLESGTAYFVWICATVPVENEAVVNPYSWSDWVRFDPLETRTVAAAPGVLNVSLIKNETVAKLTWTNGGLKGVDHYVIQCSNDNINWDVITPHQFNPVETQFIEHTLTPNTTYYFRIYAAGIEPTTGGFIQKSEFVYATTFPISTNLVTPALKSATPQSSNSVTLTWTMSNTYDVQKYEVWYRVAGTTDPWTETFVNDGNPDTLTADISTAINPNTKYEFQIRAVATDGTTVSGWSSTVKMTEATPLISLAPPTPLQAIAGTTGFLLSWTPSTSANVTGYEINYKSKDGTVNETIPVSGKDANSVPITGLTPGTKYFISIKAVSTLTGTKTESDTKWFTDTFTAVNDLATLTITGRTGTKATLNWTIANGNAEGIDGFRVYQWNSGTNDWVLVGSLDNTERSHEISGLTSTTSYKYKVVAINKASGKETSGKEVSFSTQTPLVMTTVTLEKKRFSTDTEALQWYPKLSWTAVTGAYGYEIEWYVNGQKKGSAEVFGQEFYENDQLNAGTDYSFRVKAIANPNDTDYETESGWSNDVAVLTVVNKPIDMYVVKANTTATSMTLRWSMNNTTGVKGYEVRYSVNNGADWTEPPISVAYTLKDNGEYECVLTGLTPSLVYMLNVRAVGNTTDQTSGWSDYDGNMSADITKPHAPTNVTITKNDSWDRITIGWAYTGDSSKLDSFEIKVYSTTGGYLRTITGIGKTGISHEITGLEPTTEYYFTVVSKYAPNLTDPAYTESDVTKAPKATTKQVVLAKAATPAVVANTVGSNSLQLKWAIPLPADTTGKYVTQYEIVATDTDPTTATEKTVTKTVNVEDLLPNVSGGNYYYVFEGLYAGRTYTFTVKALGGDNADNTKSVASAASASQLMRLMKPKFGVNDISATSNTITVKWSVAESQRTGILGYWYTVYESNGTTIAKEGFAGQTPAADQFTIDVPNSNTPYLVTLRSYGVDPFNSGDAERVSVTTALKAPTVTKSQTEPRKLMLTIADPGAGSDIDHYRITWTGLDENNNKKDFNVSVPKEATGNTIFTVTGLKPEVMATIRIQAFSLDEKRWSDVTEILWNEPLDVPTNVKAVRDTASPYNTVNVSWDLPTFKDKIAGFAVDVYQGTTFIKTVYGGGPTSQGATVNGLYQNREYTFEVRAVSNDSDFNDSFPSAVTSQSKVWTDKKPLTVTDLRAEFLADKPGKVTVTWSTPTAENTSIDHYVLEYSTDGTNWTKYNNTDGVVSGTVHSVDITLSSNAQYKFRIQAVAKTGSNVDFKNSDEVTTTDWTLKVFADLTATLRSSWRWMDLAWTAFSSTETVTYRVEYTQTVDAYDNPDWSKKETLDPTTDLAKELTAMPNKKGELADLITNGKPAYFRVVAIVNESVVAVTTTAKKTVAKATLLFPTKPAPAAITPDVTSVTFKFAKPGLTTGSAPNLYPQVSEYITYYRVEYSFTANFSTGIEGSMNLPSSAAPGGMETLTVTGLTANTEYYFRIIPCCDGTIGDNWSEWVQSPTIPPDFSALVFYAKTNT